MKMAQLHGEGAVQLVVCAFCAQLPVYLLLVLPQAPAAQAAAQVPCGCDAQALYTVALNDWLANISMRFQIPDYRTIQDLSGISDPDNILPGQLLRIPFSCDSCPPPGSLQSPSHSFSYSVVQGDLDYTIANSAYGNLTTTDAIDSANAALLDPQDLQPQQVLIIPINCSCGNPSVSDAYGLFGTYAAQPNDTLSSLSKRFNITQKLLRQYNPTLSFSPLQPFVSILFIPVTNGSGQYPPLVQASVLRAAGGGGHRHRSVMPEIAAGGASFLVLLGLGLIWFVRTKYFRSSQSTRTGKSHRKRRAAAAGLIDYSADAAAQAAAPDHGRSRMSEDQSMWTTSNGDEQCIRFSLDELAAATDNFSLTKMIGRGGFATVYYGEWRGQKLAIKRMEMKAKREFLNELMILSSVHHVNLVGLIGYCTEEFLTLVYEYVDNGTLDHHLKPGTNPLSWTTRTQIALDAAKGIEYIHNHTRPKYIHRDLKPNNILIDLNFRAKVGDFGLTRLINPDGDGRTNTSSRYGTYGYMAPEYAQLGHISAKMDVFAFGIIMYQIVSGRDALHGSRDLQSMFEDILGRTDGEKELQNLVDPTLGTDYSKDCVWKMVKLAGRCTLRDPELRPQMKDVVMELKILVDGLTQSY